MLNELTDDSIVEIVNVFPCYTLDESMNIS